MSNTSNCNIFINNLIDSKLEKLNNEFKNLKSELTDLLKDNINKIILEKKKINNKLYYIGNNNKIYDHNAKVVGNVKDKNYILI